MLILIFGLSDYLPSGCQKSGDSIGLGQHTLYYFVLDNLINITINVNPNERRVEITNNQNDNFKIDCCKGQTWWLIAQHWNNGVTVKVNGLDKSCTANIKRRKLGIICEFEEISQNIYGTKTRGAELKDFLSRITTFNNIKDIAQLNISSFTL
ncbi:MAG: hypothetical protein D6748_15675 [Calditrichaeota bacterium]|nr:MAG: hypothetical protein D6748_15675 [Calditrichota bacterium]